MSFDVNWDIDKHREEHESDDHWQLRRNFMEHWKQNYPEERLVCLARVFANIEFMGCRYPQEVMQEVARMSKEVNKHITYSNEYSANLPDSSNVQSLADGYTSAQYLMHRNAEETIQGSVSLTKPVDSRHDVPTNQEYRERSSYSTEAMQALVRIPEVLRTPYCNSFIYNTLGHNANTHATGITQPSNTLSINSNYTQQESLTGENCYQNQNPGNHLHSWQSRDPRIQASASVTMENFISQKDGIKSMNSQAYQGIIHIEGTHNVNEYECIAHSTSINTQSCNSNMTMKSGVHNLPVQDQMMRSNYDKNADDPNRPCNLLQHGNVATASSSEQFAVSQQTYSKQQSTYSEANPGIPKIKPTGKAGKGKIMIGDMVIKGPRARRYAYWLNAGKTQAEAEYLSQIPMGQIPEYKILRHTLGTICQLKRLNGSTIPVFKQKSKKKVQVEKNKSKTASSTIMSTNGLAGCKNRYKFWLSIGKPEEEARMLCKRKYKNTPLAQELKAKAEKEGQLNTWTQWAVSQYLKSLEAESINLTLPEKTPEIMSNLAQPPKKAEIVTNEDSDIEITTDDPEMIVISDDEDKMLASDVHENSAKKYVESETQMKRFYWWMHQGKSEEEATKLSQTPMAISDALNHIKDSKQMNEELQVKNQELNAIKTQSTEDHTEMTVPNPVPLKDKWLAFKANQSQKQTPLNKQNCNVSAKNSGKISTTPNNHLKIYIKDVKSKIVYDRAILIRDAIAQCVSDYDGIGMPSCGILQGVFVAICTDEESRDWLDKQIPTLEPWKGARLKIVKEPTVQIKVKTSVAYGRFYIPNLASGLQELSTQEDVLEKLHEQNPKLGCKEWIILNSTTVTNGRVLLVLFRERVHNALNAVGNMVHWYSRTIHVKLQQNKNRMKNKNKNMLFIIDPPNNEALKSAPSITKNVSTIMPQTEDCVVESPYNMAGETGMTPGSIICNEGTIIDISNDMIPMLVAPKLAGPSNSLAIKQESAQDASNYEKTIIPRLKNLTQPTSTEQAGQSTHHRSLTMPNVLKRPKVESNVSWGIDTPRLLSGHKTAIALINDPQGCSDSDDARLKAHYYREVRPFSGHDEEYSLEERVAARVLNGFPVSFKKRTGYPGNASVERAQEYSREERVFDEHKSVSRDRVSQDFRHNELALAEQSQEYPRENQKRNRQNPQNYGEVQFDQRDSEYSRNDRRLREHSREVFDKHEGTNSWKNRATADFFQQEGFRRTLAGPSPDDSQEDRVCAVRSKEISRENRDIRSLGNSGDDRYYEERNAEYPRNDRDFVTRRQENPREVFDEHGGGTYVGGIIPDISQEESALAGPSQEYSQENIVFSGRREDNSRENRFSERQSLEKYHEDRFRGQDADSPNNNRDFVGSHQEYPREVFDEHDRISSWKDSIIQIPQEEQVLARQSHEYSKESRGFDRPNREYSENRFSDRRISENYEGRFDNRDAEYSRNHSVLKKCVQEYPREEKVFDEQERIKSLEGMIDTHDSHEERILSHEYSRENRVFDRQSRENSVDCRFDEGNVEYSRNYGGSVGRRQEYPRKVFDEHEGRSSLITRDTQDFPQEKLFGQSRGFVGVRRECSENRNSDRRSPENSRDKELCNRRSPSHSGERYSRVFDERDQEYRQESSLPGRYQYSAEDNAFDPRKGKCITERDSRKNRNFDERNEYSQKYRDARRDQKFTSVDRGRNERDQARGRIHDIWPSQAPKRPNWCQENKSYSRSRSRGSVELPFTDQDEPRFRPRKKRSQNWKKK